MECKPWVQAWVKLPLVQISAVVANIQTGQIAETEDNTDKTEVDLDMNKILGEVISEEP